MINKVLVLSLAMTALAAPQSNPKVIKLVLPTAVEEEKQAPMPYEFEYKVDDGHGTKHARQETADENGVVRGWYGYQDANGLYRRVEYVADKGFRAVVHTNEPGTSSQSAADAKFKAQPSPEIQLEHSKPQQVQSQPVFKAAKFISLPQQDYY